MFGMFVMLLVAPLVNIPFLGHALTSMLVYIWSRRNPFVRLNFFGMIEFTGPMLPWFLVAWSYLFHADVTPDLVGISVGHLYYFCVFVFPGMTSSNIQLLRTPGWVQSIFTDDLNLDDGFLGHHVQEGQPPPQPVP